MGKGLTHLRGMLAVAAVLPASLPGKAAEPFDVALANASFTQGTGDCGVPRGWSPYGSGGKGQELRLVEGPEGAKALLIVDADPTAEIGVFQTFDLKGDETYQVSAKVRAVKDASSAGAYLQLRFLPSNQLVQTDLAAKSTAHFSEVSVKGTAPPGTTRGTIYLYTHRDPTPQVLVTGVALIGGLPPPPPVPPQYRKLKDLYLDIALVQGGKPRAVIVAPRAEVYQAAAAAIQRVIQARTGVTVPVVPDDSPEAAVPITGNRIVLGNRSTNQAIGALYDRYYCLVDLKYPGPGGYVLRSVHNPFGNGAGVVIAGASDEAGVEAAGRWPSIHCTNMPGLPAKATTCSGTTPASPPC